jgi:hypothetical protein
MITECTGVHDPFAGKNVVQAEADLRMLVLKDRYAEYKRQLSLMAQTRKVETPLLKPTHETQGPSFGHYQGIGTPG